MVERLLRFVEQAHVLDRDRRLGGEDLEELDLSVGERANLRTADLDRSEWSSLAEQRRGHGRPKAVPSRKRAADGIFGFVSRGEIVDVDGLTVERSPAVHAPPHEGDDLRSRR